MIAVAAAKPSRYRHYVLAILTLVYVVNFVDRQVLNILLQPIKEEFHVSDSILGLLAGPTFAIFYATLGIPVAWLADRFNRRNIITAALALFSLMTVICGLAAQFWQLVFARIGTGIGEAGTSPQSHSMISDLYRPNERVAALAVLGIAPFIGIAIALFVGGLISQLYGWRAAFLVAGVPGLALAAIVFLTVREPKRGACENLADAKPPSVSETLRFLWSQHSYVHFILGISLGSYTVFAVLAFMPAFLERVHHIGRAEIGFIIAMLAGVGPGIATIVTGAGIARLADRNPRWNGYGPLIGLGISAVLWPVVFLADDMRVVIGAAIIPFALIGVFLGPVFAMAQGLVPLRIRAISAAVMFFVISILGIGLGPLATGVLSDLLRPFFVGESLRYALALVPIGALLGMVFFALAARRVTGDLVRAVSPDLSSRA